MKPTVASFAERQPGSRAGWHTLQLCVLLAALAAFAGLMRAVASPGGVALGLPPDLPTADGTPESRFVSSTRTPANVVLVVSSREFATQLERRIDAGEFVLGERGSRSSETTYTVLVAAEDQLLEPLYRGLSEFERTDCAGDPCVTITIIDLREQ